MISNILALLKTTLTIFSDFHKSKKNTTEYFKNCFINSLMTEFPIMAKTTFILLLEVCQFYSGQNCV